MELNIVEQEKVINELYEKDIINEVTYTNLLEEKEEYQSELASPIDYAFIYEVEFLGIGDENNKIYYKNAYDTKWVFNLDINIGKIEVKYIRIPKSSLEYQSAIYNSRLKRKIVQNSIFFN